MITIPTVLILGAGASQPYGFPLGSNLVNNIANMNHDILRELNYDRKLIKDFTSAISGANTTINSF